MSHIFPIMNIHISIFQYFKVIFKILNIWLDFVLCSYYILRFGKESSQISLPLKLHKNDDRLP